MRSRRPWACSSRLDVVLDDRVWYRTRRCRAGASCPGPWIGCDVPPTMLRHARERLAACAQRPARRDLGLRSRADRHRVRRRRLLHRRLHAPGRVGSLRLRAERRSVVAQAGWPRLRRQLQPPLRRGLGYRLRGARRHPTRSASRRTSPRHRRRRSSWRRSSCRRASRTSTTEEPGLFVRAFGTPGRRRGGLQTGRASTRPIQRSASPSSRSTSTQSFHSPSRRPCRGWTPTSSKPAARCAPRLAVFVLKTRLVSL